MMLSEFLGCFADFPQKVCNRRVVVPNVKVCGDMLDVTAALEASIDEWRNGMDMEDLERMVRASIEADSALLYGNYDEYNPPLLNISDYIDTNERES